MPDTFDVIVIGSGFGGSVSACRLAEKGMRVLVLERGRRWDPKDYPRELGDAWVWDQDEPERQNGWLDLRVLDDMSVAQGAGVGGGSLIYANISVHPPRDIFRQGWPPEITYEGLVPYLDAVGRMLNVQELPDNQLTARFRLMREAAGKAGFGDRFRKLPLAVSFDSSWNYELEDPFNDTRSRTWTNEFGREQGTCVHCGNCCVGCHLRAKNTLDLNYLAVAERHHAEIRPLHLVRCIRPDAGGYRVEFDRLERGKRVAGSERAKRVILGAGSLGSTELLLRSRDQYRALPAVSPFLGRNWSSNGDFLTPAFYDRKISPSQGPTITCAIDFLDGSVDGQQFFIEDGGLPDIVGNYLEEKLRSKPKNPKARIVIEALGRLVRTRNPLEGAMPWFAQGVDAANGRFYLGRYWYAPWKRKLKLDWEIDRSEKVINAIVAMHKRLAAVTGGDPFVPPTWTVLRNLVTPHPLGGCNMGTAPSNGVVNHLGEVFGYPGLYVADGAVIPEALGLNPSRTIAALAERMAEHIN